MMGGYLDPGDWSGFRAAAHRLLDRAIDRLADAGAGRVWTPPPDSLRAVDAPLPRTGTDPARIAEDLAALMPYGVGNTHPRFFGWVHGAGSPGGLLAEITAAAMNANAGGRDHAAIHVERQVVEWCRQIMGLPSGAGGLLVSGTSMATLVALKAARERALGPQARQAGIGAARLVGYASAEAHACLPRAFDLLGLGADALRRVPVDSGFAIDTGALAAMIAADRAAGLLPFVIAGTAGTVNTGAIDDLQALADIAAQEALWLHIDGAFGATAILSEPLAPRLAGLDRADSIAFDFHKWLHVNYDAGCVLIRRAGDQLAAFAGRPDYLAGTDGGLSGAEPWPVDLGPELSRGFRALKVWAHLREHGTRRLGEAILRNVEQAARLGRLVAAEDRLELLAPVTLNIVCFRFRDAPAGTDLDALNAAITRQLQDSGVAVPSTTRLGGKLAIRVNLTNHRTTDRDIDILLDAVLAAGRQGAAAAPMRD